jgi:hypothetical protein
MNSKLLLSLSCVWLLSACGDEPKSTGEPTGSLMLMWPDEGWTVYDEVDFVFAGGSGDGVAVLVDKGPLPVGQAPLTGSGDVVLPKGVTRHRMAMVPGQRKVTVQSLAGGKATAESVTKSFTVKKSPDDLRVFFVSPADGATVKSPFKVRFGLAGMSLDPANNEAKVPDKTSGHHHIIVDGGPLPVGVVVPADEKNIHYGQAQTEGELTLPPGRHTLTMQFADARHASYGPSMSATISITVE